LSKDFYDFELNTSIEKEGFEKNVTDYLDYKKKKNLKQKFNVSKRFNYEEKP
jgi:hypothetical protein